MKSLEFGADEIKDHRLLAILAYIIPFVPFLVNKRSQWVRFHATQGMNLLLIWLIYGGLSFILISLVKVTDNCPEWIGAELESYCLMTPWWVTVPLMILGIGLLCLCIIGIIHVLKGEGKKLPLIGKLDIFRM